MNIMYIRIFIFCYFVRLLHDYLILCRPIGWFLSLLCISYLFALFMKTSILIIFDISYILQPVCINIISLDILSCNVDFSCPSMFELTLALLIICSLICKPIWNILYTTLTLEMPLCCLTSFQKFFSLCS